MCPAIKHFRNYFNIDKNIIYLNSASSGIMTIKAYDSADKYMSIAAKAGDVSYEEYIDIIESTRNAAALFLDVPENNVGFINNTTHCIEIIKRTFPDFRNIIIFGKSFPCTKAPFMYDSKYRVEIIAENLNLLDKALKKRKKAIVLTDYVHFLTGNVRDVEGVADICRDHNAILGIDAIQALGWMPMNIKSIKPDFLFAGASKWLLGPQGTGIMYADSSHQSAIAARNSGWLSLKYENFESFGVLPHPKEDISVVESGTRNLIGLIIMRENIRTLHQCGLKQIEKHNKSLMGLLAEQLGMMGNISQEFTSIDSPIIALKRRNCKDLYNYLKSNNVIVSYRDESIRFSTHLYNSETDIDKVNELLRAYK